MDLVFRLSNLLVLPFWALMILLPRWRWTARIMRSPLVSVAPALFYAALVLPRVGAIFPAVARPTLAGVAALLGSPEGATIAWVHFLAFDLFVGRWIYLDSQERRFSRLLTGPILFLTLMLGPLGFLGYLLLRTLAKSREPGTGTAPTSLAREMSAVRHGTRSNVSPQKADASTNLLHRAFLRDTRDAGAAILWLVYRSTQDFQAVQRKPWPGAGFYSWSRLSRTNRSAGLASL